MTSSAPVYLPERAAARTAAAALRQAMLDPSTMGEPQYLHLDFARPKRGVWVTTWPNLPGFSRSVDDRGRTYTHDLLPGWEYARHEIRAEMIPDLEALAERGERPKEATRSSPQARKR